eukprot:jgi/Tetstr1/453850/TSEL_004011.t1
MSGVARLVLRWSAVADFLLVYISEAHATDGWRLGSVVTTRRQHRSLEERCAAATAMVEAEGLAGAVPVVVDSMANVVRDAYAAWPERLFIIQDGLLVHLQRADAAGGVDLLAEEAEAALAALVPQHSIGTG